MPTVNVVKGTATGKIRDLRSESANDAFGKILSTAYSVNDNLVFGLGIKEIEYAKFVSADGGVLEIYNSASISGAITFDVSNGGSTSDISYYIRYVRGAGVTAHKLTLNVISTTN